MERTPREQGIASIAKMEDVDQETATTIYRYYDRGFQQGVMAGRAEAQRHLRLLLGIDAPTMEEAAYWQEPFPLKPPKGGDTEKYPPIRPDAYGATHPIPKGVYYREGNFYCAYEARGKGDKFYRNWKDRASEFPGTPEEARSSNRAGDVNADKVPLNVYTVGGMFYSADTHEQVGQYFHDAWKHRMAEFPTSPEEARA